MIDHEVSISVNFSLMLPNYYVCDFLRYKNLIIINFHCQSKLGVVKVLASDVFPPADVVVHFIIATGDSKSRYISSSLQLFQNQRQLNTI